MLLLHPSPGCLGNPSVPNLGTWASSAWGTVNERRGDKEPRAPGMQPHLVAACRDTPGASVTLLAIQMR